MNKSKDSKKRKKDKEEPKLSKPRRTPQNPVEASKKAQYYPEALCGRRQVKGGKWQYFVKWKDSPEARNTWEPEHHLVGFEKEISEYNLECDQAYRQQQVNAQKEKDK